MKTSLTLGLLVFALSPLICSAQSASLSIEMSAATTSSHLSVVLRSVVPLNAVEGTLTIPSEIELTEITNLSPLVSYWITPPTYSKQTRQLTFAGVLIGGQHGTIRLFEIRVTAPPHRVTLAIEEARAYTDSPDGIEAPLQRSSLTLAPVDTEERKGLWSCIFIGVVALAVLFFLLRHLRLRWT